MRNLKRNAVAISAMSLVIASTLAISLSSASSEDEQTKDELIQSSQEPLFPADDGPTPTSAQAALADRLTEILTPPDGTKPDATGLPPQLARGIIGVYGSATDGYTVVIGRDGSAAGTRALILEGLPEDSAKTLKTQEVSVAAADLANIWKQVSSRSWTSREPIYSLDIDPRNANVTIMANKLSATERAALERLGNGLLAITTGGNMSRLSRTNDPPAHWGGARINRSGSVYCSSGFTVKGKTTGTKDSLTAGHCGSNGQSWYSTSFFGHMAGKANFPDYDQARLRDSTYTNYLYTDGADNFNARLVTGANDGAINQSVCHSGAFKKSLCGITIKSLTSTFCDSAGCTTYLGKGYKNNVTPSIPGDSGGPVYLRNTHQARASVRGTIVGGGYQYMWWERYASISNHLNSTAVVSP